MAQACNKRFPGKGAVVSIAPDVSGSPGAYAAVGATFDITPPPQERADVDLSALEDDAACVHPGIEQTSEFACSERWDPTGTTEALVDGYYASGETVHVKIAITNGDENREIKFTGRVKALVPSTASGTTGFDRTIRILRASTPSYTKT